MSVLYRLYQYRIFVIIFPYKLGLSIKHVDSVSRWGHLFALSAGKKKIKTADRKPFSKILKDVQLLDNWTIFVSPSSYKHFPKNMSRGALFEVSIDYKMLSYEWWTQNGYNSFFYLYHSVFALSLIKCCAYKGYQQTFLIELFKNTCTI